MILAAEHISKAYTLKTLLTDATLYIEDGDKIGIIGQEHLAQNPGPSGRAG